MQSDIESERDADDRHGQTRPDLEARIRDTSFDVYLAVDWSSKSKRDPETPVADAVWAGELVISGEGRKLSQCEKYFRTRLDCLDHVRKRLIAHVAAGRRVFVGFDFAYGYPAGFAEACDLAGSRHPWRLVWDELEARIEDRPDGTNNRFNVAGTLNQRFHGKNLGPFWGHPVNKQNPSPPPFPGLEPKSPPYPYLSDGKPPLARLRLTETLLPGVQSAWKLFGAGSVGGQSLVGIPVVAKLRDDPALQAVSRVWPFETGFDLAVPPLGTPLILHVEIWPGVVNDRLDPTVLIRDQAQVRAMVEWLAELDAAGELPSLFARPSGLTDEQVRAAVEQEGWILGSGLPKRVG